MTQTTEIDNIKINKYTDDDKHIFNKIWELRPSDDQYFKFMGKEIKLPRRTINYSTNGQIYSGYLGASNIIESPPQFLINYLNSINYNVHDKHNNILIIIKIVSKILKRNYILFILFHYMKILQILEL